MSAYQMAYVLVAIGTPSSLMLVAAIHVSYYQAALRYCFSSTDRVQLLQLMPVR
jgi:hypothetical protein